MNHHPQHDGPQKFTAGEPLRVGILHYYPNGRKFLCFICGRQKKEKHVAGLADNDELTVCKACYERHGYIQVRVAIERPRKAAIKSRRKEAKRRGEPGSERPARLPKTAKKQKPKAEQSSLSDEEAGRLQIQVPALGHLVSFFESAGAIVQLLPDRQLKINGSGPRRLPKNLATYEKGILDSLIDDIALAYMRSAFAEAVRENANFGDEVRFAAKRGEKGFAIVRGATQLGFIRPTLGRAEDREAVEGNFLMPGPHWGRLAEAISSVEAERRSTQQTEVAVAKSRRINSLPSYLDPALAKTCMDASRRIRTERQVAYERPVVLESELGELTLLPIVTTGIRLLLPFRIGRVAETETTEGRLELILGDPDPLPLIIGIAVSPDDAIRAWTCALVGFADATCIEIEAAPPGLPRKRQRSASPAYHQQYSASAAPRRRTWPSHLEPVGNWIVHGTLVAGHRRRLGEGKTAGDEACERARQVGIILQAHETWVRAHSRGIPQDVEMRFRWRAPRELLSHDARRS